MRILPPSVHDAEALTDLHLEVWEQAYADLMPASVFAERRAGRDKRVERWRGIIAAGAGVGHALCEAALGTSPAYLWVLDGNARAIGFYEREGFRFDAVSRSEDVGLERRMVRWG